MKFGIPGLDLVFSKTQLQSKQKILPGFTTQVDEIWKSLGKKSSSIQTPVS